MSVIKNVNGYSSHNKTTFFNNLTHYNDPYQNNSRGNSNLHDYGRGAMSTDNNVKRRLIEGDYTKNYTGPEQAMNYLKPDLPITKKQTALYDQNDNPMLQPLYNKPRVYETVDAPKTTLRQTMIDNDPIRNLKGLDNMNEYVPDVNVYVPNPTLKQDTYVD